jgi:hypothetical protein|nr:MAG TPA: hypothetical protein [Caudoviricetes sp.]
MKKEYVIAMGVNRKDSSYKFTKFKSYEVLGWFGKSAEVRDDDGKQCFVAVGAPTLRLEDGCFVRVNYPSAQEAMESAERAAAQAIRNLSKGGYIQNAVIGDGIISGNITVTSDAAIMVNGKRYTEREIKNLEKYAEMHKRDCIAAEAVVDRLYDIFTEARNPDQLVALARQAKIFSDAFKEMQKL